jgi:hypothetical protein
MNRLAAIIDKLRISKDYPVSKKILYALMASLPKTEPDELTCAEVYELIDQYAELVEKSGEVESLMPRVEAHLKHCGECHEELEALLAMLEQAG